MKTDGDDDRITISNDTIYTKQAISNTKNVDNTVGINCLPTSVHTKDVDNTVGINCSPTSVKNNIKNIRTISAPRATSEIVNTVAAAQYTGCNITGSSNTAMRTPIWALAKERPRVASRRLAQQGGGLTDVLCQHAGYPMHWALIKIGIALPAFTVNQQHVCLYSPTTATSA